MLARMQNVGANNALWMGLVIEKSCLWLPVQKFPNENEPLFCEGNECLWGGIQEVPQVYTGEG